MQRRAKCCWYEATTSSWVCTFLFFVVITSGRKWLIIHTRVFFSGSALSLWECERENYHTLHPTRKHGPTRNYVPVGAASHISTELNWNFYSNDIAPWKVIIFSGWEKATGKSFFSLFLPPPSDCEWSLVVGVEIQILRRSIFFIKNMYTYSSSMLFSFNEESESWCLELKTARFRWCRPETIFALEVHKLCNSRKKREAAVKSCCMQNNIKLHVQVTWKIKGWRRQKPSGTILALQN